MVTHEKIDKSIDCIGLYCPMPLLNTRSAINEIEIGQILEVFSDDPASDSDIKALINRTGQELVKFEDTDGEYRFLIKKLK
ncbi:MAG: sulfurtransferase TusA family protein [Promethearchaeota archaeon]